MKTHMKNLSILVFIIITCSSFNVFSQNNFTKNQFFSYERFVFTMELLESVKSQPKSRKDLKSFATYFNNGIYSLSNGKYSAALNKLYKSRNLWPEYFGTSFLIALTYERNGQINKAAMFYKEYLNKLKTFESGHFPISAPLIKILNVADIDTYLQSKTIIKDHLNSYGLDLNNIKAPLFISEFVKTSYLIFILIIFFFIGYHWIWPYFKKQHLIKNVAPGFWICKNCQEDNPDLVKECSKCGKLNEEN